MKLRLVSMSLLLSLLGCGVVRAQELDPDPDRVFVTSLKWERVSGAPDREKLRYAHGTLVLLYLKGVYAEVTASFVKTDDRQRIALNLDEGFIVRLGDWSRTDDEDLIRIEKRDVIPKGPQKLSCKPGSGGRACVLVPETLLPGPLITHTCRLERRSPTHIADTIVCNGGLVVSHPKKPIDLADFPDIVRQLVTRQQP